jgi:formiminotetrahydrofolate cyclodeaminase
VKLTEREPQVTKGLATMILMDLSMRDFVNELASTSPAPGGGTVAAVTGAYAAGLGSMVCGLTIGNEKYPHSQVLLTELNKRLDETCARMVELADEDTAAFNKIMAAFKLPKSTTEEREQRSAAIRAATRYATEVPLETALCAVGVAEALIQVALSGNTNALSDCGTAIECARTAAESAFMNVDINLPGVGDEQAVKELSQKRADLQKKADCYYNGAMELVKLKQGIQATA